MARAVAAIYTNAEPALRADRKSVAGPYVIAEFAHDPDLSLPTTDSDRVVATQNKPVKAVGGAVYAASAKMWSNAGQHGNGVAIRSVDAWEQNHWWWDDTRSTYLEYSIYLPNSFLAPGGEKKAYPLVLAITHSGTSYDGTCAQTLTEQCIATIWSLPENHALHECVVITPRYERTTMNGAMTSLWLMAKHPGIYAGGLIIAGQQRPSDVITLAHQNVLIITGSQDDKATPWNEKCVPIWRQAGAKVTRPTELLDPSLIFPIGDPGKAEQADQSADCRRRKHHLPDVRRRRPHGICPKVLLHRCRTGLALQAAEDRSRDPLTQKQPLRVGRPLTQVRPSIRLITHPSLGTLIKMAAAPANFQKNWWI